ncbi:hypothetical protein J6590_043085 [Homalodisca vitripennis]|nr:hypothetical protein J6590_043085 [Homalodisca vitripennis]
MWAIMQPWRFHATMVVRKTVLVNIRRYPMCQIPKWVLPSLAKTAQRSAHKRTQRVPKCSLPRTYKPPCADPDNKYGVNHMGKPLSEPSPGHLQDTDLLRTGVQTLNWPTASAVNQSLVSAPE